MTTATTTTITTIKCMTFYTEEEKVSYRHPFDYTLSANLSSYSEELSYLYSLNSYLAAISFTKSYATINIYSMIYNWQEDFSSNYFISQCFNWN